MTKRKPLPEVTYRPGFFSEPVTSGAGFHPGFVSQIVVSPRTGKMESDYERQSRIREASGWTAINWTHFGRMK